MTDEQIIATAGEPDATKPLPCPFCGSKNVGEDYIQTYSIDSSYDVFGCKDCGARFEDGSIEDWNKRSADAILVAVKPLRDRIAELEAEVGRLKREDFSHERLQADLLKLATKVLAEQNAELTKQRDGAKFKLGDRVKKIRGSCWSGKVVGFYSTALTPEGYAVESSTEHGSVQIYPASALEHCATGGAT